MLMGGALSAPAIFGIMNGCTAKPSIDWKPEFLNADQASVITRLVDIIVPATDTPGAKEVGVPAFIDKMLKDVYSKEEQEKFLEGLRAFQERAQRDTGEAFADLEEEEQTSFATKVHNEDVQSYATSRYARPPAPRPFFLSVKELALLGFFTSETGATQVLQYVAVPGAYNGCVPLSEAGNGKAWAT